MLYRYKEKQKKHVVTMPLILEFRSRADHSLLQTSKVSIRLQVDRKLKTVLNWALKDHGQTYEATLMQQLKDALSDPWLLKQYQKHHPDLPPFYLAIGGLFEKITWDE